MKSCSQFKQREKLSILKILKHRKSLNHFGTSVNPIFLTMFVENGESKIILIEKENVKN